MLVRRLQALPIEAVVRGYLIGSGWKDYQKSGAVCGIALPRGLQLAAQLPQPLFTPANKAPSGQHDENIPFEEVASLVGAPLAAQLRDTALALYAFAAEHARSRGIIIADTKFEFGVDARGTLTLIDEVLTPDSSRFWPADTYRVGTSPPSFDKQFVRDYLETLDWNKRSPGPRLPPPVIARTSEKYREALARLTSSLLAHAARQRHRLCGSRALLARAAQRHRRGVDCEHGPRLDSPVDSVGRLRAPRRGGRCGARRRRRPHSLRRDGQSLRAESHHRADGVRGPAPPRGQGADRRAPDGAPGGPHRAGLRRGRRDLHHLPPGSQRARRSHHRADSRAWLPARPGVQSRDAARLARLHARAHRHGADHVGESRIRRPGIHPHEPAQARRRARARGGRRTRGAAGGRRRDQGGQYPRRGPGRGGYLRGGLGDLRQWRLRATIREMRRQIGAPAARSAPLAGKAG